MIPSSVCAQWWRLAALAAIVLGARGASAQVVQPEPGQRCVACAPTEERHTPRYGFHWHDHWARVGLREYVTIPLLVTSALLTEFVVPAETDADWEGPILFDQGVRDALAAETPDGREAARVVSDASLGASLAHVFFLDNLLVTHVGRQSAEVAWQLFVINAQAYAFTAALNSGVKRLTARQRPWADSCPFDSRCGTRSQYSSFYSGHSAITATSAGLLCAHHTQLQLYKDPVLDTGSCLLGIALTGATGALRIASDNHWASDVVIGHLMGYVSGYLLPTLLYYRDFRVTAEPERHPVRVTVIPVVGPNGASLRLAGLW